jgi:hypothetical protein
MDADREGRDDRAVAIGLGDLVGLDDELAGFLRVGGARLHGALRPLMAAVALAHGLQFAKAAHVALAARRDAIAQPVLLALDRLAELVLLHLLLLEDLVAPGFEMGKAAVEAARGAAIEPDGGIRDLFEEATVMRDDDKRAAGLLQLAFQPFDGRQVEMVGRLVEQQDVGLGRHERAQGLRGGLRRPTAFSGLPRR